jgi:hypothetical protein
MSEEEIINRLKELSQETGEELLLPNITNQEDVKFTSPDYFEEPVGRKESDVETNVS